jgi:hypothetical protein
MSAIEVHRVRAERVGGVAEPVSLICDERDCPRVGAIVMDAGAMRYGFTAQGVRVAVRDHLVGLAPSGRRPAAARPSEQLGNGTY